MQLQQLRYVVAVAEEQHFTRAAARLHVAQPSVSSAVRDLERELGAPLFHRARGTVDLTAAGEVFLLWARQALADVERGRVEVRELLGLRRGRLALGATPSLTTSLLPPALADFHARWPDIALTIREAGSRDLATALAAGALDVALVILPVPHEGLATTPLAVEELVLAVPADHPLAGRDAVEVADLRDLDLVVPREGYDLREATLAACHRAGFAPRLSVEGGEMAGVLALAAAGLGAAVVPSTVGDSHPALRAIRFASAALTRTIGLAERADRPRSRASHAFSTGLQEQLAVRGWPGVTHPGLTLAVTGRAGPGSQPRGWPSPSSSESPQKPGA